MARQSTKPANDVRDPAGHVEDLSGDGRATPSSIVPSPQPDIVDLDKDGFPPGSINMEELLVKNSHIIDMIKTVTMCAIAFALFSAIAIAFVFSAPADRLELLNRLLPLLTGVLGIVGGAAAANHLRGSGRTPERRS